MADTAAAQSHQLFVNVGKTRRVFHKILLLCNPHLEWTLSVLLMLWTQANLSYNLLELDPHWWWQDKQTYGSMTRAWVSLVDCFCFYPFALIRQFAPASNLVPIMNRVLPPLICRIDVIASLSLCTRETHSCVCQWTFTIRGKRIHVYTIFTFSFGSQTVINEAEK